MIDILSKVVPIPASALRYKRFFLFGNGGFAQRLAQSFGENILGVVDYFNYRDSFLGGKKYKTFAPSEVGGVVVLGTGNGSYQYNQLKALRPFSDRLDRIYIIDEYMSKRNIHKCPVEQSILLLEHADGVIRHEKHLVALKNYCSTQGRQIVSICPNTLMYYSDYLECPSTLIWGGQRELYKSIDLLMRGCSKSFVEYGFFPQSKHIYLDRLGVNHECSLMTDDLSWVENYHFEKLKNVKARFLDRFKYRGGEYVLVPLQVPDDANVVNTSRFVSGMQEFIDYIINYYPSNQRILFKPHPKDPNKNSYSYHGRDVSELPFLVLLESAIHVHGITSSTLYESVLAGVDVLSEGVSLLNKHKSRLKSLLAAMVDRQVEIDEIDIGDTLKRYSNLLLDV
ncbi:capsular polysaccharide export protein, LipB/KpsS family [Catenovulum sediminis]|uniref:Capsule polysaccharide biosynthesis protein n=1 Tax=Catenovulum sediminis TaxID=1740262 RepID=A0ABV1RHQ9_9ALTE